MESRIDSRSLVLDMLLETFREGRSSSYAVGEIFKDKRISARDRSFTLCLYRGVLERAVFLDFYIEKFSKTPFEKIKPVIKNILRMGLYQMFFMDSVPQRAAVSESVALASQRGFSSLKGYVNAVLRTAQREGLKGEVPDNVRACVPLWMYEKVSKDLGKEEAEAFFKAALEEEKTLSVRFNTLKASSSEIIQRLEKEGVRVLARDAEAKEADIRISGSLEELPSFKEGLFYVQSPNSMEPAREALRLSGRKDPLILDVCAAPGGKSIDLALDFPKGKIISRDKSEDKVKLIGENSRRMGLLNIRPEVWDAALFDPRYEGEADIVIADVPCSGLGVIGRKPDIKYRLKKEDIPSLAALQRNILKACAGYVKKGGILIYSTCTLFAEENSENALWFKETEDFALEGEKQYIKSGDRADGFYTASFRKN